MNKINAITKCVILFLWTGLVLNEEKVKFDAEKEIVIGIDLGTTYSVVAVYRGNGNSEVISNALGNSTTPSVVRYDLEKNTYDVGEAAKQSGLSNVFYDAKRMIGLSYNSNTIQQDMKIWPFKIVNMGGKPAYEVAGTSEHKEKPKHFFPVEISAKVLKYLKKAVEEREGKTVKGAVITVPAYFGTQQRQDTMKAGALAGLEVFRVINEPTAAALAFGLGKMGGDDELVLVYDLGGGTFDASLLEIDKGTFEVKSSGGDAHLGGQDFDRFLIHYFLDKTTNKKVSFKSLSNAEKTALKNEAERVKMALSNQPQATFSAVLRGEEKQLMITRTEFNKLIAKLVRRTMDKVRAVVKEGKVKLRDIAHVVLIGGSSKIPYVREQLQKLFVEKRLRTDVDPDKAVAQGAAINAAIIAGVEDSKLDNVWLMDVTPFHLGIEVHRGMFVKIVEKNSKIPTSKSQVFTTVDAKQTNVQIVVLQGTSPLARKNKELGRFTLSGIATGHPEIEITIKVDANGIVSVRAFEKGNGQQHEVSFENALSFSTKELEDLEERFRESQEEDEREEKIIKMQETVRTGAKKLVESGQLEAAAKQKLEDLLKEINLVTDFDEAAFAKTQELHAQFLSLAQMYGGKEAADSDADKDSGNEEDYDEYEDL